jgi:hypothetical protein
MTLAPRFLVKLIASYRMRQLQRRLRAADAGLAHQQRTFAALMSAHAQTEFGRLHGLGPRTRYADYRTQVPLRTPGEFSGWVERMAAGAVDVLWPGRCRFFVYTAGTVDGTPKPLPATPAMLAHYRAALGDALLLHAAQTGQPELFLGRHLHVGASTALNESSGAYAGYLDAMVPLALSEWSEKNLYAPPRAIARLPDGPEKLSAIAAQCSGLDVRVLAGTPETLAMFAGTMRTQSSTEKQRVQHLRAVWPNLTCCVHTGSILGIFADELRANLGPGVALQELYAGAEGIYAAQDGEPGAGLRLLTEHGLFFEFLPTRELAEGNLAALGGRCVALDEVQPDLDYALVVTTPAGLCRCLVGDSVRFVSTKPPRLVFTGRTQLQLNSLGEHVTEREVTAALLAVCVRNDWTPVNFHVAPYFTRLVPRPQGSHEWWVELRPGTVRTPTGPLLAAELDAELSRAPSSYTARRANGAIEAPIVRLVMPGTFAEWTRLHGSRESAGKFARCRSDRLVADQLAGIARFHTQPPPMPRTS